MSDTIYCVTRNIKDHIDILLKTMLDSGRLSMRSERKDAGRKPQYNFSLDDMPNQQISKSANQQISKSANQQISSVLAYYLEYFTQAHLAKL